MNTFSIKGTEHLLEMSVCIKTEKAEYSIVLRNDYRTCCNSDLTLSVFKNGTKRNYRDSGNSVQEGATLTQEQVSHPSVRLAAMLRCLADPYRPAKEHVEETIEISGQLVQKIVFESERLANKSKAS